MRGADALSCFSGRPRRPSCWPHNLSVAIVQSLSHVLLFVTPWTVARQAFLPISWSLPKFRSIESVMPSNHLILCHPLLLLPSVFPSIRGFPSESAARISHLVNSLTHQVKELAIVKFREAAFWGSGELGHVNARLCLTQSLWQGLP